MALRQVERVFPGQPASDGAGVRLLRVIGTPALDHFDPFLLLDEFRSDQPGDYLAGFPDHPHRGFETVTYMLAGAMRHADHVGNRGHLRAGSVQWMTAGRGIIHSEMPEQEQGLMWGFQLWVNLPKTDKLSDPRYQDIPPERVPEGAAPGGVRVRVIAGTALGLTGPVEGIVTEPVYLDVAVPAGQRCELPLPPGHNACAYVFEGAGRLGLADGHPGTRVERGRLALLGSGDAFAAAAEPEGLRLLLLAGRALHEPIARYGPFVMNTSAEIQQALRDLRDGTFLGDPP